MKWTAKKINWPQIFKDKSKWHRWFAWYPVRLGEGSYGLAQYRPEKAWLQIIERKLCWESYDCQNIFGADSFSSRSWRDYRAIT